MIALDTNVVVRLLIDDHAAQHAAARSLLGSGERLLLTPTVLLESDWVLRDVYGLANRDIAAAFAALCATSNVEVANEEAVAEALRLSAAGVELADALHLAAATDARAKSLASFDRALARKAKRADARLPVTTP
ncbi:MAG: PIN domain-containing protein [Deltaproteobacteria bacterium]|nr:PIN domain-containing protein [Deltaproteobacteria bacterium]